jgi:hypothetical protein
MAGELQMVFGSATTVISHAAALASAANTYSGLSGCTMTQLDNSTTLYPYARAVLGIPDTFAAAPTAGATVDLYMTMDDIDGTSDETPGPGAMDIIYLAKYVGSFVLDNQDVANIKPLIISLEGVQKAQFYILNSSGQQISYSTNPTTVKITPFTYAPAA